ncbi:MAG: pentapeptide repeat-containing protein [Pseudomonadota bacterium]
MMQRLTIVILFSILISNQALACSCFAQPFEEAFRKTPLIFEGELISSAPLTDGGASLDDNVASYSVAGIQSGLVSKFRVTREIKGVGREFRVIHHSKADGGNCGITFVPGIKYRIFANKYRGKFLTGMCTYTSQITFQEDEIVSKLPEDPDEAFEEVCKVENKYDRLYLQYAIASRFQSRSDNWFIDNYLDQFRNIEKSELNRKIAAGRKALEFNDFERAKFVFKSASSENPNDIRAQLGRSKAAIGVGAFHEALIASQAALSIDENSIGAQEQYAKSLLLAEGKGKDGHHDYRNIRVENVLASAAKLPLADFSHGFIDRFDVSTGFLPDARFLGFSTEEGIFHKANLSRARFDFSGDYTTTSGSFSGDFSGAILKEASFINVEARKSNFSNADLRYANFENASVSAANFQSARFLGSQFTDAYMYAADFAETNLQNANFSNADLRKSNFAGANLRRANLVGAKLGASRIDCKTKLPRELNAKEKKLIPIEPHCGRRAQNRDFSSQAWDYADFSEIDLSGASFVDSHIQQTNFQNANLQGASFRGADGYSAIFNGADLTDADFSKADITGFFASSRDRETGAALTPAKLDRTIFSGAKLSSTSFLDHNGKGVAFQLDLGTAIFDGAQFRCSSDRYRRDITEYADLLATPADERPDYENEESYIAFRKRRADEAQKWLKAEGALVQFLISKWPSIILGEECQAYVSQTP